MKIIGLIGGVSWQASAEYYRIINEAVTERLGSSHSAKSIMVSVDFYEMEKFSHEERWDAISDKIVEAAHQLEAAGADFFLVCANTLHLISDEIQQAVHIPLLHIADVTAQAIQKQNIRHVGLLGTTFTMEKPFYREWLASKYGIETMIPEKKDRDLIHKIIFKELIFGKISMESRQALVNIIASLGRHGAQGIVLGCTELPLLIQQKDCTLPVFDTTQLHAMAAVEEALS